MISKIQVRIMYVLLALSFLFIIPHSIFAQTEGDSTIVIPFNFKTGEKYHITIKNGFDPTGVIVSQDSVSLIFKTEYKTFSVNKSEIIKVDDEYIVYKIWKDKRTTDTTSVCDIYTKPNYVYRGVRIIELRDSTLTIIKGNNSGYINVKDITIISFWKTAWLKGASYGFLAGFAAGFVFGLAIGGGEGHPNFGRGGTGVIFGILTCIPGAIIGGIIGGIQGDSDVYNFKKYDYSKKIIKLRSLIEEYKTSYY